MKLTDDELDALLKRLHLANARKIWQKLVQQAEKEEWSYRDFLALLVAEEIAQRQQTRLGRLSHRARFPFLKTIDDFNFTYQSTLRLALLGSALAPDFITEGRCLILYGKPGRGKTHLAVALAYRAIQNGFDAYFTTAAELIDDLSAAFRQGRLAEALTTYTHPGLLVVDEVGYLTYGTDAANMLFHVVNDRHRRKHAMIFTTNKPSTAWGRVLHDEDLAQAIVDRILERGRLLTLDGPSMRTKHLGLDDASSEASNQEADNLARISGITRPEFPEPAPVKVELEVDVGLGDALGQRPIQAEGQDDRPRLLGETLLDRVGGEGVESSLAKIGAIEWDRVRRGRHLPRGLVSDEATLLVLPAAPARAQIVAPGRHALIIRGRCDFVRGDCRLASDRRHALWLYDSSLNGLKTLTPGRRKSRSFPVTTVSRWRRAVAAM
jgi:DNA replication protein DnaC